MANPEIPSRACFPIPYANSHNEQVDFQANHRRVGVKRGFRKCSFPRAMRACAVMGLGLGAIFLVSAQEPVQTALTLDRTLATLHGVVRNAATGEPLPRALVRIEGDADTGVLTDGEGRFEIPGLPVGPQSVEVQKPGFLDRSFSASGATSGVEQFIVAMATSGHNVMVAAEMPDVVFTLTPACAIHGQIELSTGDPAQGIELVLLRRTIEDGRAMWQASGRTKTHSDGTYRFAGLADGEYALFAEAVMENDPASVFMEPGSGEAADRRGYASVFFPGAHDLAGAAKIRLDAGQETQANLTLTLEPFHTVTAEAVLPGASRSGGNPARAGMSFSAVVLDAQGHTLPYMAQYDPAAGVVQALLPDGSYSLRVTAATNAANTPGGNNSAVDAGPFTGAVEFSVAGHAVSKLRVPLGGWHAGSVQATVARTVAQPASRGTVVVMVSPAEGGMDDSMVSAYASGPAPGSLQTAYTPPGSYWAHLHIGQKGLCEASFTAGGASLAREPVVMGLSGAAAPMELALRDDCARLTLSLPPSAAAMAAGEEPFYTVYVVPDFDFTTDIVPVTLRSSTGGTMTVDGLTPGSYHVFTFDAPVSLEYRTPAALAALPRPGQAVTLSPGSTANLVVEAPAR
jgi:hypothetical protein